MSLLLSAAVLLAGLHWLAAFGWPGWVVSVAGALLCFAVLSGRVLVTFGHGLILIVVPALLPVTEDDQA